MVVDVAARKLVMADFEKRLGRDRRGVAASFCA